MPATRPEKPITRQEIKRLIRQKTRASSDSGGSSGSGSGSSSTITQVNAGVGLDGGGSTGIITIDLADTAVTPGTYGDDENVSQITVDQQGRITAAVDVPINFPGGPAVSDPFYDPPLAADFATAITNGANSVENEFADITDVGLSFNSTIRLSSPGSVIRVKTLPSAPITITMRYLYSKQSGIVPYNGMILRASSDGDMETFGLIQLSAGGVVQVQIRRGNGTTLSTTPFGSGGAYVPPFWGYVYLQLAIDGSGNTTYSISSDGHNYHTLFSSTLAAHVGTADQIGFFMAKYSNSGTDETQSMMITYYNEA